MPAILQADGTLVIIGTSDPDFMSLSGKDGIVNVKSAGYRNGQYTGVRKVVFNGGNGDDQLAVADGFNIPIQADGGNGDDLLMGGTQNDTLNGGAGNDQLNGQDGDDVHNGNGDADSISGGAGNDQITGGSGNDLLQGGGNNDTLDGQEGNDDLEGDSGDDLLNGGIGDDVLYGGSGQDVLNGNEGDDALNGDEGNDQLNGGIGNDILSGGANDDSLNGGEGDDSLAGDAGNDSLYGELGRDTLQGGDDNDFADGGAGQDLILGDAGNDELHGGDGEDTIHGGDGQDTLRGGRDNDSLNGDAGADDINGEAGEDTIAIDLRTAAGTNEDTLAGGVDRDTLWVAPAFQNVAVLPQDQWEKDSKGKPIATLSGSTGNNWIHIEQTNDDFTATQRDFVTGQLIASANFRLSGGTDTDLETITIAGLDGNDLIDVSPNVTRDLILDGGDGNDTLLGGAGRDVLRGQSGHDLLVGNAGDDELHGGDSDAALCADIDPQKGIYDDTLEGGTGSDRLYGDNSDDSMNGGEGFDVQFGGTGNDRLETGPGIYGDIMYGDDETDSDSWEPGANTGNQDTIIGGDGADIIFGGGGNDVLEGGGLNDVIMGGAGNDTIRGGAGADYLFGGDGKDKIYAFTDDLTAIDEFFKMDWEQKRAELTDFRNKTEGDFWEVDSEIDAIDILDGVEGKSGDEKKITEITESGKQKLLSMLTDAKAQLAYLKYDSVPDKDQARQIQLATTRIQVWDSLDGNLDGALRNADGNLALDADCNPIYGHPELAQLDINSLPDLADLQSRLDQQLPEATRLDNARKFADALLYNMPSEYQNVVTDIVAGEGGDDELYGTIFADKLFGGSGDDTIHHSTGDDVVIGGEGAHDSYLVDGTDAVEVVVIRAEKDSTSNLSFVFNVNRQDTATISLHPDIETIGFDAKGGNDTLTANFGKNALKNVEFHGGDGDDSINVTLPDKLYDENGKQLFNPNGTALQSHARLYGDTGNDTLVGGLTDDSLDGGAGNDSLNGGDGNDTLVGGDGVDQLDGGAGNDSLSGGNNDDYLVDSLGMNTFSGGAGSDYVDDRRPENQLQDLEAIDLRASQVVQQVAVHEGMYLLLQDGRLGLFNTGSERSLNNIVRNVVGWGSNGADISADRYQLGDFNGDGRTDVISFESNGGLYVWIASPDGGFTNQGNQARWGSNGADIGANRYQLGDFNGDGRTDVVSFEANGGIYLRTARPLGGFNNQVCWGSNGGDIGANRYQLGDFNGDGRTDVISVAPDGGLDVGLAGSVSAGAGWQPLDIGVTKFAVAPAGSAYSGQVFSLTSAGNLDVNGMLGWSNTKDFVFGSDGSLYLLNTDGLLKRLPNLAANSTWETILAPNDPMCLAQSMALSSDGTLYELNKYGQIFQMKPPGGWQMIIGTGSDPMCLAQSMVLASDGTLYELNKYGQIYQRQLGGNWELIQGQNTLNHRVSRIALRYGTDLFYLSGTDLYHGGTNQPSWSNTKDFAIGTDGSLYWLGTGGLLQRLLPGDSGGSAWQNLDASVTKFAVAPAGSVWSGAVFTLTSANKLEINGTCNWIGTKDFAFGSDGSLYWWGTSGLFQRLPAGGSA